MVQLHELSPTQHSFTADVHCTLCLRKKHAKFETLYLKIIKIDFDDIWQKYSKDSRIESACFSFLVGLLFYQLFVFQTDTKNNANFDAVSSKRANFDEVQFLIKHIPNIYSYHNIWHT